MSGGIKISISGDVATAGVLQQAVSSDTPNLMILDGQQPPHAGLVSDTITTNLPVNTTYKVLTIPHGLGFIPSNLLSWSDLNRTSFGNGILSLDGPGNTYYFADADATNFYITFVKNSISAFDTTGQAWNFRYYIFCTPAT